MKKTKKWTLKAVIREIVVDGLIILVLANVISYFRRPDLPFTELEPITVTLVDGSTFKWDKDRPLVLHFWGTWCSVCRAEASNIDWIAGRYDVLTVAVNSGDDQKIMNFLKQKGLKYKVLNDRKGVWAQRFHIRAFPTTFIFDKHGKMAFAEVGYTTTIGLLFRLWWAGL